MIWRSIFLWKLSVFALLLLAVFYCWLHGLRKCSRRGLHPAQYLEKFPFRLQQNGDYWIFNDFILAGNGRHGNQSMTLTTHGTYMDLGDLEHLVVGWDAPISLALFVGPWDFGRVITSFHHLRYCSISSLGFGRWVSVQLVMHQDHMPRNLRRMEAKAPYDFRCEAPFEMDSENTSIPQPRDLRYPLNLMKNVARLNARTYYVFPMELNAMPVRNFANNFMEFVRFQDIQRPQRSVFCVPVFPQLGEKADLLKNKSDLLAHLWSHLNGSRPLALSQLQELKDMEFWFNGTALDGEIGVLRVEKSREDCVAHVAANAHAPLYDQRCADPPFAKNSSELQVLAGLGFDFVLLDGVFLIQRPRGRKISLIESALTPAKANQIRDLIKLNSLVLK